MRLKHSIFWFIGGETYFDHSSVSHQIKIFKTHEKKIDIYIPKKADFCSVFYLPIPKNQLSTILVRLQIIPFFGYVLGGVELPHLFSHQTHPSPHTNSNSPRWLTFPSPGGGGGGK